MAFGARADEIHHRTPEEWARSAREASAGDERIWLLAEASAAGREPDAGGVAVGLIMGSRRSEAMCLASALWVDPSTRGAGVGRSLWEALDVWGGSWGARLLVGRVYVANRRAVSFHEALGFRPDPAAGATLDAWQAAHGGRPRGPGDRLKDVARALRSKVRGPSIVTISRPIARVTSPRPTRTPAPPGEGSPNA